MGVELTNFIKYFAILIKKGSVHKLCKKKHNTNNSIVNYIKGCLYSSLELNLFNKYAYYFFFVILLSICAVQK